MLTAMASPVHDDSDNRSINQDLNRNYSINPMMDPVLALCKHHRLCLENRTKLNSNILTKNHCDTESPVLNRFNYHSVRCSICEMTNIQHENFGEHGSKQVHNAIANCSSIDLKCSWTGSYDQLENHIVICPYERIRPILDEIIQENQRLKNELKESTDQQQKIHVKIVKSLQIDNHRLNDEILQLQEMLNLEKRHVKQLQNELQQMKKVMDTDQLKLETQGNSNEIHPNDQNVKLSTNEELFIYRNSRLEFKLLKFEVKTTIDLSNQQIFDRDVEIIVKQALIDKQCTRLDLGSNEITEKGASMIADALQENFTLEELEFHHNHISDIGVHSLAAVLSGTNSTLKALGLGSNGITDDGVESLAKMLKTNRTVTWLALAGNQISDHGAQLLFHTLADQNNSLRVLSLHVNEMITDASIDSIVNMIGKNQSLKKLWMQHCSFTEKGKQKLKEAVRNKAGFLLYM